MSEREFENYLALLGGMLRLSGAQRKAIAAELRDHMQERLAELAEQGVEREQAVKLALEEFGDAAALADEFEAVGRIRRRRLMMRYSIVSAAVAAAVVLIVLSLAPVVPPPGSTTAPAIAQTPIKQEPPPGAERANPAPSSAEQALERQLQTKLQQLEELEQVQVPIQKAEMELRLAEITLQRAKVRFKEALQHGEKGLVSEHEAKQAEFEVVHAEMKREMAQRELHIQNLRRDIWKLEQEAETASDRKADPRE